MFGNEQLLISTTPDRLAELIAGARSRLVVLAPALPLRVAEAIRSRWLALGPDAVSVTLDVDPEVYRLGYGDFEALTLLEQTGREVHGLLQRHPGVRIGVVVADQDVLIYAPVPELIEAGPRAEVLPTGLLIKERLPSLEAALGVGEAGVLSQEVGLDKATLDEIEEVHRDLVENPPQKFDVAHRVRVFNAAFQFVELTILGTKIHRRKVQIPSYLLGVADEKLRDDLSTALKVVPERHELSGTKLDGMRQRLEKRHLTVIPGYGHVVLRSSKEAFLADLKLFQEEVEKFKTQVGEKLDQELDERVNDLADAFLPRLLTAPPSEWMIGSSPETREASIRKCLEEDLRYALGCAEDYVGEISTKVLFKDVTYELLSDERFVAAARKAFPKLKQLHSEFDAAAPVPAYAGGDGG